MQLWKTCQQRRDDRAVLFAVRLVSILLRAVSPKSSGRITRIAVTTEIARGTWQNRQSPRTNCTVSLRRLETPPIAEPLRWPKD